MKKTFAFFLMVAAAAAGCTSEVQTEELSGEAVRVFTCILEDSSTKVSIDAASGKTAWQAGDRILIHAGNNGNERVIVTLKSQDISEKGKRARIAVPASLKGYDRTDAGYISSYYALYPADALTSTANLYYETRVNDFSIPPIGGYDDGEGHFIFRNICGLMQYTVSGDFDSWELTGNADEDVAYTPDYQCRLALCAGDDGEPYEYYKRTWQNEADSTPQKQASGSVTADGKTVNYICIPSGVVFSKGFHIRFLKDGEPVYEVHSDAEADVSRNHILKLGDITSRLQKIAADEAVNLSREATANCYVIPAPGSYKFKAVKGNSSTSVGSVSSATVLWETCCNATAPAAGSIVSNVCFSNGWVYFQALKAGNALIAVEDATGTILWSWHIWIPSTAIGKDSYSLTTHQFMDRNLGALDVTPSSGTVPPETFGLLYQWGRKDPFIGAKSVSSDSQAAFAGVAMSKKSGQMSLAETLANPTRFAAVEWGVEWCSNSSADFWGWQSEQKGLYDPCPPGYKVPRFNEAMGLFNSDLNSAPNFNYNSTLGRYTVGNPVMVVPLCGYYEINGSHDCTGSRSILWNATHDASNAFAARSQYVYYDGGIQSAIWSQSKARAGSVRCVTENEVPFENAEGMPVIGSYTKTSLNIHELSGMCFSKDRDFIWGVGDEGYLYKITLDLQASYYSSPGHDLEGVTIDPGNGDMYFSTEPNTVYKATAASGYKTLTEAFSVSEAAGYGNSGLEGITYFKDGVLYVGAQTGATLWAYKTDGTMLWKKQLGSIAPMIQEIGGLCYDAEKDWLWVTDSESYKLFVFDGAVTRLLAVYNVAVMNNESVLVDRERSCVYVGDDYGDTSYIYKYKFTNL